MESIGNEFLAEVMNTLNSLSARVNELEREVAALKGEAPAEETEAVDIDFEFDIDAQDIPDFPDLPEVPDLPQIPEVPAISEVYEVPQIPEVTEVPEVDVTPEVPEVAATPEVTVASEISEPAETMRAELFVTEEPVIKTLNDVKASKRKKTVAETMSNKVAWRTAIAGSPVKDIRSAISMNDRVMLINSIFREDSMLFQDTVAKLNAMESLDEALGYIESVFPEWDMSSDAVYRFMMAVRRKIR